MASSGGVLIVWMLMRGYNSKTSEPKCSICWFFLCLGIKDMVPQKINIS